MIHTLQLEFLLEVKLQYIEIKKNSNLKTFLQFVILVWSLSEYVEKEYMDRKMLYKRISSRRRYE